MKETIVLTPSTSVVRINSDLVEELRQYQQATGVPIVRCVEEAVSRWLTCVAPARIEAMTRTSQPEISKVSVAGNEWKTAVNSTMNNPAQPKRRLWPVAK